MKMIKTLAVAAGIAIAAVSLVGCGSNSPEDVAKTFTTDIINARYDDAMDLLDFSKAKEQGKLEQAKSKSSAVMGMMHDSYKAKGAVDAKVTCSKLSTTHYSCDAHLLDDSGKEVGKEHYNVIKVDGDWRIK